MVRLLDMQSGLFGSNVCSVTEDSDHAMWVVTDHGVSKVVPVLQDDNKWQFSVSSYNNRDGLMQGAYNQRSMKFLLTPNLPDAICTIVFAPYL